MYGIDVYDDDLMTSRPWTWLRVRIEGLLTRPDTRLFRHFFASPTPEPAPEEVDDGA